MHIGNITILYFSKLKKKKIVHFGKGARGIDEKG